METNEIREYLRPGRRVHLVGIGGVSMSPLAEVLHSAGVIVTGSDQKESGTTERLRGLGIPVALGHLPDSVQGAECVIRTAAVHDENPEIAAAREQGIPVYERAQAWGAIMQDYRRALCISGTHGKTTTTSMCTQIIMAAGMDPTVMIGGTLPALHSGYRVGGGDLIILESCEYCNSFLSFFPTIAVILNIEADHLDFFRDLEEVRQSFRAFADRVPEDGWIVANCEDENTMAALAGEQRQILTFGTEKGEVRAEHIVRGRENSEFDVVYQDSVYAHISLPVPGMHNVRNALAAAAACLILNVPGEAVERGLMEFRLPGRRLERKGEYHGAQVYDDYAHHPGELAALLDTARGMGFRRILCAFQPHTYSRTRQLFDDFVEVLRKPDITLLAEIYAARESNTTGISSRDLADRIDGSIYCPTLEDVTNTLEKLAEPGDLILTVGAGDICRAGEALLSRSGS